MIRKADNDRNKILSELKISLQKCRCSIDETYENFVFATVDGSLDPFRTRRIFEENDWFEPRTGILLQPLSFIGSKGILKYAYRGGAGTCKYLQNLFGGVNKHPRNNDWYFFIDSEDVLLSKEEWRKVLSSKQIDFEEKEDELWKIYIEDKTVNRLIVFIQLRFGLHK